MYLSSKLRVADAAIKSDVTKSVDDTGFSLAINSAYRITPNVASEVGCAKFLDEVARIILFARLGT